MIPSTKVFFSLQVLPEIFQWVKCLTYKKGKICYWFSQMVAMIVV